MGYSAYDNLGLNGAGTKRLVSQDNDFEIGDCLRMQEDTYVRAQANSSENAEVIGVVESCNSATFVIVFSGEIDFGGALTLTPGARHFLKKEDPGKTSLEPPLTSGTVKKCVYVASTTEKAIVVNYLGLINGIEGNDLVELLGIQPVGSLLPYSGTVSQTTDIPEGWLLCDGGNFSSLDYPELASLITNTYGPISGNSYTLPDLRGRATIGCNVNSDAQDANAAFSERVVGMSDGMENVPISISEMPRHDHPVRIRAYMDEASNVENSWFSQRIEGVEGKTIFGMPAQYTAAANPSPELPSDEPLETHYSHIWQDGVVLSNDWNSVANSGHCDLDYGLVEWPIICEEHGSGNPHTNMQPFLAVNWLIRAKRESTAALLTVNLQQLADVDNSHSCGAGGECVTDGGCNTPQSGDVPTFNQFSVGRGNNPANDKFVITSNSNNTRNEIINGNFDIWQRNTSFSSNNVVNQRMYTADRWCYSHSSDFSGTNTILQGKHLLYHNHPFDHSKDYFPNAAPSDNTLQIQSTIPMTNMGDTSYVNLNYNVEGYDFRNLYAAGCFTLSFYVIAKHTGTYCVHFRNQAYNMSYVSEYTITESGKWHYIVITVPSPPRNERYKWDLNNDIGLRIGWKIAGQSNTTESPNEWIDGAATSTTNQVNGCQTAYSDSDRATFEISQVQLEAGSIATPFQTLPHALEVERCERYFEKTWELATPVGTATGRGRIHEDDWVISRTAHLSTMWRTRKRATPAVEIYDGVHSAPGWYAMTHRESGSDVYHHVQSTFHSETGLHSITRKDDTTLKSGFKNKITFHYATDAELYN